MPHLTFAGRLLKQQAKHAGKQKSLDANYKDCAGITVEILCLRDGSDSIFICGRAYQW